MVCPLFLPYFQKYQVLPDNQVQEGPSNNKRRMDSVCIENPESEQIQADERIRRWARIEAAQGKYLRVILLPDAKTVHNAFFDRGFKL